MKYTNKPPGECTESLPQYEPVAYDVSVIKARGRFLVVVREDDKSMTIPMPTLEGSQEVMESLKPDVFSAPGIPWSVFCPRRMSYAIDRQESQRQAHREAE